MTNHEQKNETIAQFMGYRKHTESTWVNDETKGCFFDFSYHNNWNQLMKVVEKIIQYTYEDGDTAYLRTFGMKDDQGNYMVRFNRMALHSAPKLLEALYEAVFEWVSLDINKLSVV